MTGIVVVGAGQAGVSLVARLRTLGYSGPLTLVGEEPVPPYQRPPLSKGYLTGEVTRDRLILKSEAYFVEHEIELRLSSPVTAINLQDRQIAMAGESLAFDQLVLTTGAEPRALPDAAGGSLEGVHCIRNLADIDRLRPAMIPGRRLLVVGGGYIGLEAAAVGIKMGLGVTLLEAAQRILQRVAARETAAWFRDLHRQRGVVLMEGVALEKLVGENGRVTGALLEDGQEIDADLVVAGIGVRPRSEIADAAGLRCDNGIVVDEFGRTSVEGIWAAGDCTCFPWRGTRIRLESVGHAIEHAETVASNMLGGNTAYVAKPWFWSDQYDVKLQIAGLNTGFDRVVARHGAGDAISFWYFAGERLIAVDSANDPRAYMAGKRIIDAGKSITAEDAADPDTNPKDLIAKAF
jgi:3-phenylpropionate/trans-cinnamate dioxygenase ferredoxin reductase subunit